MVDDLFVLQYGKKVRIEDVELQDMTDDCLFMGVVGGWDTTKLCYALLRCLYKIRYLKEQLKDAESKRNTNKI